MRLDPQDLQTIVSSVGNLVDARAETTEAYLEAKLKTHINSSEQKLQKEIQAVRTELKVTKVALQTDIGETRSDIHELRTEVKEVKTELKADIHNLRNGVAKKLIEHEVRIEKVEKATKIPSKH